MRLKEERHYTTMITKVLGGRQPINAMRVDRILFLCSRSVDVVFCI